MIFEFYTEEDNHRHLVDLSKLTAFGLREGHTLTLWRKVQHGEWKYDGFAVTTTKYKCSVCGLPELEKTKFCPNCGAQMVGGRT